MGRPVIPVVMNPRLARSRLVARLGKLPPGGAALLVAPARVRGHLAARARGRAVEVDARVDVRSRGAGGGIASSGSTWVKPFTRGCRCPDPTRGGPPEPVAGVRFRVGPPAGDRPGPPAHRGRLGRGPGLRRDLPAPGGQPAHQCPAPGASPPYPARGRFPVAGGWAVVLLNQVGSCAQRRGVPRVPRDDRPGSVRGPSGRAVTEVAEGWIGRCAPASRAQAAART